MVEIIEYKKRDLCENSIFLNKTQKENINKLLNEYFNELYKIFSKRKIKANIYYSGSLARQEPAILYKNGNYGLDSDIDFVIVTEKSFNKDSWLMNITDWMNSNFPNFQSSVVLTTKKKLSQMRSFVGRDLEYSINSPIYSKIGTINYSPRKILPMNYLEKFVNVLSCYFLHPNMTGELSDSIIYKNIEHFYIKTILEGLRLQFLNEKNLILRYCDLYKYKSHNNIHNLISEKNLISFLKARELRDVFAIPEFDIIGFISNALLKPFEFEVWNENSFNEFFDYYIKSNDFITLFQGCLLLYILFLNKNFFKYDLYSKLKVLLKHTYEICSNNIINLDNLTKNEIIKLLREMRMIYIKKLYYINTNNKEIPDLKQKYKQEVKL